MFTGLTSEICAKAWDMLQPTLRYAYDQGILRAYAGTIVLLNPADPAGEPLFRASLDEYPGEWSEFAEAKARLVLRTGVDTTRMRTDMSHLYQPGDVKWPGGILRDGLYVGFSGVQGEYDEMIGEWFVAAVRAMCRIEFFGPEGEETQPTPYLGREA